MSNHFPTSCSSSDSNTFISKKIIIAVFMWSKWDLSCKRGVCRAASFMLCNIYKYAENICDDLISLIWPNRVQSRTADVNVHCECHSRASNVPFCTASEQRGLLNGSVQLKASNSTQENPNSLSLCEASGLIAGGCWSLPCHHSQAVKHPATVLISSPCKVLEP